MKLSVIIVSYNVQHFLEHCLHSVREAMSGIAGEVFVVDNHSADASCQMVREKFPEVKLIENQENLGFSKANNQAIRLSSGSYMLLLNPDTVIEADTLQSVCDFMDAHPEAGGLGVKMVDGKGRFLPESKRSLPTPGIAFAKVFGLSRLFPRSRTFGRYHLGYLDKDKIHEVEVLSGAFMLLRRSVIDQVGLLDETFFMYGEDIDLSYRIIQAGYKNYYFPHARIIHYKGESTKKSSTNYVFTFYQAMIIFARKHFSKKNARVFSFLIQLAVWFRASISLLHRFARRMLVPAIDATLMISGLAFLAGWWESHVLIKEGGQFPGAVYLVFIPLCVFIWLISIYFSGGYDRPFRNIRVVRGMLAGTVVILVAYALLPEMYRFSRALIVLGAGWGTIAATGSRYLLHLLKVPGFTLERDLAKRFVLVGAPAETQRVENMLREVMDSLKYIGAIHTDEGSSQAGSLGPVDRLRDIITIYQIDEVIFCAKNLPASQIIDLMAELQDTGVEYKIAPPESLSVIGSSSINTAGELYVIGVNTITNPGNQRLKALLDVAVALVLLFAAPLLLFVMKQASGLLPNIFEVFSRKKSWVGYSSLPSDKARFRLPKLRPGVLNPADAFPGKILSMDDIDRINILYARDYNPGTDLRIIWRALRSMGRREQKQG